MAKEDILNEKSGFDSRFADSMNPDYGWSRRGANSTVTIKAAGGRPMDLETQNDGRTFTLSFTNRSLACIKRVERFAKQFRRGFFTLRDFEDIFEGAAREYVGRFTSVPEIKNAKFGKFSIEGITFEEVPSVAMNSYPANWNAESIFLFVRDDFGDQQIVTQGDWSLVDDVNTDGTAFTSADHAGSDTAAWAQYEYKGYGFRIHAITGPDMGIWRVYLDGELLETIDLYSDSVIGPSPVFTNEEVPLDFHRVKIVPTNTKNGASTGTKMRFVKLEVMQ